jgi:hypothetical protein
MTTPPDSSVPSRLEVLEARFAIEELRAHYARAIDKIHSDPNPANAAAFVDLFTDDGVLDLGPLGRFEGRAALLEACENLFPQVTQWSMHYMLNPLLTVNGDEASGSWYFFVPSVPSTPPNSPVVSLYGTYTDHYVKVGGVWRFKEVVGALLLPPV